METATALWALDDLLERVAEEVQQTGRRPSEVIDEMAPIRLRPDEAWRAMRQGLIFLFNCRVMPTVRSGKFQTNRGVLRRNPVAEEGLSEYHVNILERLIYEGADGTMKALPEFEEADARWAMEHRVERPRAQADREEPFWRLVLEVTAGGRRVGSRSVDVRAKVAKQAIACGMTPNGE